MPKDEMAVVARRLAKRDEVRGVELEIWMKMKWAPMVDLKLHLPAAHFTGRVLLEMRLSDGRPMRRTFRSNGVLSLRRVDDVLNDFHGR